MFVCESQRGSIPECCNCKHFINYHDVYRISYDVKNSKYLIDYQHFVPVI